MENKAFLDRVSDWRSKPVGEKSECKMRLETFYHLEQLRDIANNMTKDSFDVGKIMRWLYVNSGDDPDEKRNLFKMMFPPERNPELYAEYYGADANISVPEFVSTLTETDTADNNFFDDSFEGLSMSPALLKMMKLSLHPPHVAEKVDPLRGRAVPVPNPAFPFCQYQDKQDDAGVKLDPYTEHFCKGFQATINEVGLCYTYNNYDLGMDPDVDDEKANVRKVKGCGKKKGLRVVVDSHKFATKRYGGKEKADGFIVFITVPGVVTHKVPFIVDSEFFGEHHFHLHGIHFIDSSPTFKEWNKEHQVCYYPEDRNMSFFSFYTQDNCLLECRYHKISKRCGCSPWYLKQDDYPVCGKSGNACFKEEFNNYQEDLADRTECDCRSDCGGIHIFSSMNKYPFSDKTATEEKLWWDSETKSGRLANYLLDPDEVFVDSFTRNMTKLRRNMSTDAELADHRFQNELSVLNFFFDTPIITRITLEMRITIFDQISAIGGTLGLFTGVSLITFAEILYWLFRFVVVGAKGSGRQTTPVTNISPVEPNSLLAQKSAANNPTLANPNLAAFGY